MSYYLKLFCNVDNCQETVEFDEQPTPEDCYAHLTEWIQEGSWGVDGGSISGDWDMYDDNDDIIESGGTTVEVEPDHKALIEAAGGDVHCSHKWSNEGEGGCDQNPGVWSTGGTGMTIATHCEKCGLRRVEHYAGSQRNPGEPSSTYTYVAPENGYRV